MRTFARDDVNLAVRLPSWHVGLSVEAVGGASWAKGQALRIRLVDGEGPLDKHRCDTSATEEVRQASLTSPLI